MNVTLQERQPVMVTRLRSMGFGGPLDRSWRTTIRPWLADHGLVDCPKYGVVLDDSAAPPERCRYEACVELPPGLTLSDAEETRIAGGWYAVACFRGADTEIGAAWSALRRESQARGSRIDATRPAHERCPRGALHDARTGVFACELCLPVEFA